MLGEKDKAAAKPKAPAGWRASRALALLELALVAFIFYADHRHWVPVSKTPFLLLLGWLSLRLRGLGWSDVGFSFFRSKADSIVIGVLAGAALEAFQLLVTQPYLARLFGQQPDLSDFHKLAGNIKLSLLALALTWTLAAFGEEMVWRGYVMNRVADLGRRRWAAWLLSALVVSAVFGFAHEYQGITGWAEEAIAGLALALLYFATRRNLAVPIVAHGVADTIDVVLMYLGRFPGM